MKTFLVLLSGLICYTLNAEGSYNSTATSSSSDNSKFEKILTKLNKTINEKEAVKLINELVYQNYKFSSFDFLREMYTRKWLQASQMILDFLIDGNANYTDVQSEVRHMSEHLNSTVKEMKTWIASKKKNIVRISPVFEWSQDNEVVKIRLKFAKNLESPGEKDIQKFQVNCTRTHLLVQGYKVREDYVSYYYRNLYLYDNILPYTCKAYKETDGTYIIKFNKGQNTMYWNFLDQITESHHNTYTWFEVFTPFENKSKYTEFRDWAMDNLLQSDLDDHVREKMEEKKLRMKKIENIYNYFRTKGYENKNYCRSPINEKYCYLQKYYDWDYWLN
jgi:hypothetical protein